MTESDSKSFRFNPDYNYYVCAVERPNCQLFIVRLEWEGFPDDIETAEKKAEGDECEEGEEADRGEDDDGFTLVMIPFQGMNFIMVGLDRAAHQSVLKIAEELDLNIRQGYPLSVVENKNEHFPCAGCAGDSIFTLTNKIDVTDKKQLRSLRQHEKNMINKYLDARRSEQNLLHKESEDSPYQINLVQ